MTSNEVYALEYEHRTTVTRYSPGYYDVSLDGALIGTISPAKAYGPRMFGAQLTGYDNYSCLGFGRIADGVRALVMHHIDQEITNTDSRRKKHYDFLIARENRVLALTLLKVHEIDA